MEKVFIYVMAVVLMVNLAQGAILDQSQEVTNGNTTITGGTLHAQTFTAGISGQLDHIDLLIGHQDQGDQGYPTTVSIIDVVGGVPSSNVLGTIDSCIFDLGWNSVDFLSESIFLTSGIQYGILITNDDPESHIDPTVGLMLTWTGDPYPDGAKWRQNPYGEWYLDYFPDTPIGEADIAFRTYMVPEPTTILLLGLGAVMLRKK